MLELEMMQLEFRFAQSGAAAPCPCLNKTLSGYSYINFLGCRWRFLEQELKILGKLVKTIGDF